MNRDQFREALLEIMEGKTHWGWSGFTTGAVPADRLHIHLEQEWEVYVRDFPILLARAFVQCPIAEVRRDLAENLYEEETGGLHAGKPHPVLFLEYPRGLNMDLSRFEHVALLPAAQAYRDVLDHLTQRCGWQVATTISTLWIEGHAYERALFDDNAPPRPERPLEDHPLVKHYGLAVEHLALTKAHRGVEGDHRVAAWRMILDHIAPEHYASVVAAMDQARVAWLAYRDEVSKRCGLNPA